MVLREPGCRRETAGTAAADAGARSRRLAGWAYRLERAALRRRRRALEFALTNIAIYWFTGTSASSARFYYETARAERPTEPTTVPIGLASFGNDFKSIRRLVDRDHKNVVSWHEYEDGGHYAAHQAPDVYVDDVRAFYSSLR